MNASVTVCPRCGGTGIIDRLVLCVDCGYDHEEACPRCGGAGYLVLVAQDRGEGP